MNNGHFSPLVVDYQARLEAFRDSDKSRDAMVVDLIRELYDVKLSHEKLSDDYANETESRRRFQRMYKAKDQELNEHKRAAESSKEAYVLVDGDGAIFLDELIVKGREGGVEAAHKLQTEIKKHLQSIYPEEHVDGWNIIVQLYLNMEGLSRKLQACGITSGYREYADFTRAVTITQPFFDIIDVGPGKENADFKLRKKLQLVLRNAQCAHVIVGPCHDNGYLTEFRQYDSDVSKAKITLLEATPSQPGFESLGFRRLSIPEVFRSQSLPDGPLLPAYAAYSTQPTQPAPVHPAQPPPQRTSSADGGASLMSPPQGKVVSLPGASLLQASLPPVESTWANVSKANGPGPGPEGFTIVNNRKKQSQSKYFEVSRDNHRIDPPLPRPAQSTVDSLNNRKQKYMSANPCNNFHITGVCRNPNCRYEHGERLPQDEISFLRVKARGSRCSSGKYCADFDCYLGHHCPRPTACNYGNTCHFSDTHGMDLVPAKRIYEDGVDQDLTAN